MDESNDIAQSPFAKIGGRPVTVCKICKKNLSFSLILCHRKTLHRQDIGIVRKYKACQMNCQSEKRLVQHKQKHQEDPSNSTNRKAWLTYWSPTPNINFIKTNKWKLTSMQSFSRKSEFREYQGLRAFSEPLHYVKIQGLRESSGPTFHKSGKGALSFLN